MKKRHIATMTAMVLAGALLAGCSSGTAATEAAKATQPSQAGTEKGTEDTAASDTQDGSGASEINRKLFFCPKSVGFDYWTSAEKGIMEAAKTLGYDAVFNGPATTDSAQQISMIQDMLAQGIGGLAIAPNDAEAISATIKEAQDKGVNTITFDTDAPNSTRSYLVCPDSDYSMGQELGKMIAEEMGQEGQLAFMVASFSAENQVSKVEGATDYLKENCPDIEIVTTVNSDDDNETAFANAQTLLTTYPDLKGILGFAGAEAPQAAEAITQAISNGEVKEGQIAVTGIGFPNQCRPYIKSGVLKQVLSWNPTETGKVACYVLAAMAEGKPIDATFTIEGVDLKIEDGTKVYHGCILLTPENIDEYDYS